ncbi:MAG: hypothetical protein KF758_03600 [Anaerolineales bacterium]|nr:hypothetical protein [Anaerolineales bacterium]
MRNFFNFMIDRGIFIVLATVLCIIVVLYTNIRMEKAKTELEEYFLAKSCPSEENCREKIEAKVLESYGVTVFVKGFRTKHAVLPSFSNTTYGFKISSIMGINEVEITSNPPSNGTSFDISNVHIPTGRSTTFIEVNFVDGQKIYVEVWQKKITFLYVDEMVDIPTPIIQPTPNPNSQPIITNNPSPNTYEIALPTTIHPIFRQASAEKDFFYTFLICSALLIIVYSSQYKNIKQLINSMKNPRKINRRDAEET